MSKMPLSMPLRLAIEHIDQIHGLWLILDLPLDRALRPRQRRRRLARIVAGDGEKPGFGKVGAVGFDRSHQIPFQWQHVFSNRGCGPVRHVILC